HAKYEEYQERINNDLVKKDPNSISQGLEKRKVEVEAEKIPLLQAVTLKSRVKAIKITQKKQNLILTLMMTRELTVTINQKIVKKNVDIIQAQTVNLEK
ncbi:unnamed protein product, partial [Callosobruchus maculatus]